MSELKNNKTSVATLKEKIKEGTVTILYGANDEVHNEAQVILDYIKE